MYRISNENLFTNINLYRSSSNSNNITTLSSIPSIDDCQQNAQLCASFIF